MPMFGGRWVPSYAFSREAPPHSAATVIREPLFMLVPKMEVKSLDKTI